MLRFTLRELALSTIIVAMGLAWWYDRWFAETAAKDFHETGHQQLLE
jgi:hypothetical protein